MPPSNNLMEYRVESFNFIGDATQPTDDIHQLNLLATSGWQVIAVLSTNGVRARVLLGRDAVYEWTDK